MSGVRTRIWNQVLDRHDGSYIVRYKVYESYEDVMIGIEYNGHPVADTPYKLEGMIAVDDNFFIHPVQCG